MAIARTIRPQSIITGVVTSIRPLETRDRSRVYADEVTLQQEHGAALTVTVYRNEKPVALPTVGEGWLVLVEFSESRDYGASLNYVGPAAPALDALLASVA